MTRSRQGPIECTYILHHSLLSADNVAIVQCVLGEVDFRDLPLRADLLYRPFNMCRHYRWVHRRRRREEKTGGDGDRNGARAQVPAA